MSAAKKNRGDARYMFVKICIADDHDKWHPIIQDAFRAADANFRTTTNTSGLKRLVRNHRFDIITCDTLQYGPKVIEDRDKHLMPAVEKLNDLFKEIKTSSPDCIIIFVSGKPELVGDDSPIEADYRILKPKKKNGESDAKGEREFYKNSVIREALGLARKNRNKRYHRKLSPTYFKDLKWLEESYPKNVDGYKGKWVAIKNKKVVLSNKEDGALRKSILNKGNSFRDFCIAFVADEEPRYF